MAKKLAKQATANPSYYSLLNAVSIAASMQNKDGLEYERYCIIKDGWLLASNAAGVSVGIPLKGIDIETVPNTDQLLKALSVESDFTMSIERNHLHIRASKFKAKVNCLALDDIFEPVPDFGDQTNSFTDNIGARFKTALKLAYEFAAGVNEFAGVQLADGLACATDRKSAIQIYHGVDTPPLLLPAEFCKQVSKLPFNLSSISWSDKSATLHYGNGVWFKTSLLRGSLPDINKVLPFDDCDNELPKNFFAAIAAIKPFSESNRIYFRGDSICTDESGDCNYELETFETGCFNAEYLERLKGVADTYYIDDDGRMLYFFGDKLRGAIAGYKT